MPPSLASMSLSSFVTSVSSSSKCSTDAIVKPRWKFDKVESQPGPRDASSGSRSASTSRGKKIEDSLNRSDSNVSRRGLLDAQPRSRRASSRSRPDSSSRGERGKKSFNRSDSNFSQLNSQDVEYQRRHSNDGCVRSNSNPRPRESYDYNYMRAASSDQLKLRRVHSSMSLSTKSTIKENFQKHPKKASRNELSHSPAANGGTPKYQALERKNPSASSHSGSDIVLSGDNISTNYSKLPDPPSTASKRQEQKRLLIENIKRDVKTKREYRRLSSCPVQNSAASAVEVSSKGTHRRSTIHTDWLSQVRSRGAAAAEKSESESLASKSKETTPSERTYERRVSFTDEPKYIYFDMTEKADSSSNECITCDEQKSCQSGTKEWDVSALSSSLAEARPSEDIATLSPVQTQGKGYDSDDESTETIKAGTNRMSSLDSESLPKRALSQNHEVESMGGVKDLVIKLNLVGQKKDKVNARLVQVKKLCEKIQAGIPLTSPESDTETESTLDTTGTPPLSDDCTINSFVSLNHDGAYPGCREIKQCPVTNADEVTGQGTFGYSESGFLPLPSKTSALPHAASTLESRKGAGSAKLRAKNPTGKLQLKRPEKVQSFQEHKDKEDVDHAYNEQDQNHSPKIPTYITKKNQHGSPPVRRPPPPPPPRKLESFDKHPLRSKCDARILPPPPPPRNKNCCNIKP